MEKGQRREPALSWRQSVVHGNAPGHMGQLALGQPHYLGRAGRAAGAQENGALTSITRAATSRKADPASSSAAGGAAGAAIRHVDEHALRAGAVHEQARTCDGGDRSGQRPGAS